jgi:hypothetical protein
MLVILVSYIREEINMLRIFEIRSLERIFRPERNV